MTVSATEVANYTRELLAREAPYIDGLRSAFDQAGERGPTLEALDHLGEAFGLLQIVASDLDEVD